MPASSVRPFPLARARRAAPSPAPLWRFALAARAGDAAATARTVGAARRLGWPRHALEETALLLTLYAGYPAAIEALRMLQERWPGAPTAGEVPARARRSRGLAALEGVYGPARPALLRGLRRLHPALATWVIEHGYGRVLARPRLDDIARELVTVALLAGGPWERQLVSHRQGAQRLGAGPAALASAQRDGIADRRRALALTPAGRVPKMRARMAAEPAVPPRIRARSDRPPGRERTW